MRNGIRNELMQIHTEQKAERDANRKAKKATKKTGKAMAVTQAAASSSLETEVVGSTAPWDKIPKPPNPQVVIDRPTTSTDQQSSPGQQLIEDKKSHSPQTGQTPVSSPLTSKPLSEHSEEVDTQSKSNIDDAMLFDEHPLKTPASQIQRFRSAPPPALDTSEMEVDWHGQLDTSTETGQGLWGWLAGEPVPLSEKLKMRGKTVGP
jgi:hypothetical protein